MDRLNGQRDIGGLAKGSPTCNQATERRAQTINVGSPINTARIQQLFAGHVGQGTHQMPDGR